MLPLKDIRSHPVTTKPLTKPDSQLQIERALNNQFSVDKYDLNYFEAQCQKH